MNQLTQQLKSGKMEILDVPFPALKSGCIMVRNHYSVISTGTEGKTVMDARKGYIAKAKSRQKEVKQVIEMMKAQGLSKTYKTVMNKLEAPSPLGYSTAGEVIAVGEGVTEFKVGDYAACGGASASHADVVVVPKHLAVYVPEHTALKQAAFCTIAAIAIQGIRQADLRLGENCLIIGMGLIGQLTYKILEASGMTPIGIDISDEQIQFARRTGLKYVYNRNMNCIEENIRFHTRGMGADAIIITAGTSSLDPVEFAGSVARKKGKVIIVGAVPTGFSRANYYKKELELKMSMSYGPGRNDNNYEEKGQDYPIGYVRWTENRNMQSYIDLLTSGRLDVESLISHTFSLDQAPKAYDLIVDSENVFSGIVIEYDTQKELKKTIKLRDSTGNPEEPNVGFIGAGAFAQGSLLPNIKGECNFTGVVTASGTSSKYIANKYGFEFCSSETDELFKDSRTNTIFIATRHNLHAENVIKAIQHGKHVFVEKPLALNEDELHEIQKTYEKAVANGTVNHVMVGFNRRFSPTVRNVMSLFNKDLPKSINIRVNAGTLPVDHWVNDPEIGGGRIIGEACHFIDLAMYLSGSKIMRLTAEVMKDANHLNNTVCINLKMKNGSVASINYFSNGNTSVSKETIEVFCGGTIAQIDDFKSLVVQGKKRKKFKFKGQDKGHADEVKAFLRSIKDGTECPIPLEESYLSTLATIKVLESISQGRSIQL